MQRYDRRHSTSDAVAFAIFHGTRDGSIENGCSEECERQHARWTLRNGDPGKPGYRGVGGTLIVNNEFLA